jgi:hypothetical protein
MSSPLPRLILLLISLTLTQAHAAEFKLGEDIQGKLSGSLSLGTMMRTEDPSPHSYGFRAGIRAGLEPGYLGGNADASDLNWRKGDLVSTALLGHLDLTLKRGDSGLVLRSVAWYDDELKHGSRPYGNFPNGFTVGASLSDRGFDQEAKFSNARIEEAYLYTRLNLSEERTLDLRLGRQLLNWGTSQYFAGGINVINGYNQPGHLRPGALNSDAKLPVGMAYANLAFGPTWGAEVYLPYDFHPMVMASCGTFYNTAGGYPTGCNYVSLISAIDDPSALSSGIYLHRRDDITPRDSGQYGLSLSYNADSLSTRLRAYAINYHSHMPLLRVFNADIAGGYGTLAPDFSRLRDPKGLGYALIYPEDVRLLGISVDTRLSATTRLFGEIAYRENQPVEFNTADVAVAFLTRNPDSALNRALGTNALAPAASFDDYQRLPVTTASVGINTAIADVFGQTPLLFAGEIGWNHVGKLPAPGTLRYGRSDAYGVAAMDGLTCVDTSLAQKACAHDGFVTRNAWGYRLRLASKFTNAISGATLSPSLTFSHDVDGYSDDFSLIEGRKMLRPALRADWVGGYFAEVNYSMIFGGRYNIRADRDNLVLVGGLSF